MNRKRKSADILAQLGEPLPLPYKAKTTEIKSEPTFGDSPSSNFVVAHDPIRHRRLFSHRENSGNSDFSENNYDAHVPLPIWRRDRGRVVSNNSDSFRNSSGVDDIPVEEDDTQIGEETIFTQLQQQLEQLKLLYDSKDAIDLDERKLQKISDCIQSLIEEKQQQSIVHELERIQREAGTSGTSSTKSSKTSGWKVVFWVTVVLFLLSASFFAGQHSYEYCYYFC